MQQLTGMTARPARRCDVEGIATLVNDFAATGVMLPRTPESIAESLHDYVVVADERGRVLACGALREYSPSVAEVAAIAVSRDAHGQGLGRVVVSAVEQLARRRGIEEVFALTLTPPFFAALGYDVVDKTLYPEKVRRDCAGCAKRFGCVEVCMRRFIAPALKRAA